MPQQICVLEALLKKGVHMTISVCCPVTEYENEREIYLQTEKTVQKVYELSQTYGLENEYTTSDGLRHLKERRPIQAFQILDSGLCISRQA